MNKNNYRKAMEQILEGLNDLMADLEDIRDDAQECLEESAGPSARADIARIDEALKRLDEAAQWLEGEGKAASLER